MGFEYARQKCGEQNFHHVEDDERHDAKHKRGTEVGWRGRGTFDEDEPSRAERVAHDKTQEHGDDLRPKFFLKQSGEAPINERGKDEADDIAARHAAERGDTAFEPGEHGRAHESEQNITRDGDRSFFTAEQSERQKDGEQLQRERNGGGNGDPSAYADKRGEERDEDDISRIGTRGRFFLFGHFFHSEDSIHQTYAESKSRGDFFSDKIFFPSHTEIGRKTTMKEVSTKKPTQKTSNSGSTCKSCSDKKTTAKTKAKA